MALDKLNVLIDDPTQKPWIEMLGKFMLNMGSIELHTRLLILQITGTDQCKIFGANLHDRLEYLKKRYPKEHEKFASAMNTFAVADKLRTFRNEVAHSTIITAEHENGVFRHIGIVNFTPKDKTNVAQYISLEELTGRVNEANKVALKLSDMQSVNFLKL